MLTSMHLFFCFFLDTEGSRGSAGPTGGTGRHHSHKDAGSPEDGVNHRVNCIIIRHIINNTFLHYTFSQTVTEYTTGIMEML